MPKNLGKQTGLIINKRFALEEKIAILERELASRKDKLNIETKLRIDALETERDALKAKNEELKKDNACLEEETKDFAQCIEENFRWKSQLSVAVEALKKIKSGKHWHGCKESVGINDYCNCHDEMSKEALAQIEGK